MNRFLALSLGAAGLVFTATAASPPAIVVTNRLLVTGMHCQSCARGLASELRRIPGVQEAGVTLSNRLALVVHEPRRAPLARLVEVIREAGYDVETPRR